MRMVWPLAKTIGTLLKVLTFATPVWLSLQRCPPVDWSVQNVGEHSRLPRNLYPVALSATPIIEVSCKVPFVLNAEIHSSYCKLSQLNSNGLDS